MNTLNLTQHVASNDQVSAGVVEPADKEAVQALLTFDSLPTATEIAERAGKLAIIASESGCKAAMIGGAPFLMGALEEALAGFGGAGVKPLYAFSVRESADQIQADGSVRKTAIFRHLGFVEVM